MIQKSQEWIWLEETTCNLVSSLYCGKYKSLYTNKYSSYLFQYDFDWQTGSKSTKEYYSRKPET